MHGWMDAWMDGEVLIIGKVAGWSGRVPKCLTSGWVASLVGDFRSVFFLSFFFDFFRCWVDFGKFREAKMEAKIDFWEVFFRCFFRVRVGIDFGLFFGGSEP